LLLEAKLLVSKTLGFIASEVLICLFRTKPTPSPNRAGVCFVGGFLQ
jgi:hypothetical protein